MNPLACHPTARLAALCLAAVGTAALSPTTPAEEWSKSYTVSGRAQIRVDTNDGAVRVITGDSKQVAFRVIYQGFELNNNLHVDSRQDGDSVQLSARVALHWGWSLRKTLHSLEIEVRAPRNADFQIDSGDGSVETQKIDGRLKVHTGDGSVRAQAVTGSVDIQTGDGGITLEGADGDIQIRTGDGSIVLEGARGDMRLHSGDGHIQGRHLDGKLDASSGDGHINIDGRLDVLNIKTGDGSVNARLLPGSKVANGWHIRTADGAVDVVVPADLQANIQAITHDGRISLGIPVTLEGGMSNSQVRGKMNGGGQPFIIETGDGSIRLSKS